MVAAPRHASNKLLNLLREDAYRRVEPKLRPAQLRARQILYKPNEAIREVYFPEEGGHLHDVMANGDTVEAATVGREGASLLRDHQDQLRPGGPLNVACVDAPHLVDTEALIRPILTPSHATP